MVVSFFTVYNLTFNTSRGSMIHIVLPSNLLMFLNKTDIKSPFNNAKQLRNFFTIVSRNFSQLIQKNTMDSNLMLQQEWKILISMKSMMIYELSLFNTILIILFITICILLLIESILQFFYLHRSAIIKMKKHKQMYQCYVDSIKVLRLSQRENIGRNGQISHQKYIENARILYSFFGIHQKITLPDDMFMMKIIETEQ